MAAPIRLRPDFDAPRLRALAKHSRDPDQTRRLVALAAIYAGASRTEAAQIGCVTLQRPFDPQVHGIAAAGSCETRWPDPGSRVGAAVSRRSRIVGQVRPNLPAKDNCRAAVSLDTHAVLIGKSRHRTGNLSRLREPLALNRALP